MNGIQIQKNKETVIEAKLDKIANLLELLVEIQSEEFYYPPESRIKKHFLRECREILKGIKNGRIKTHTYSSMAEFTKTLG